MKKICSQKLFTYLIILLNPPYKTVIIFYKINALLFITLLSLRTAYAGPVWEDNFNQKGYFAMAGQQEDNMDFVSTVLDMEKKHQEELVDFIKNHPSQENRREGSVHYKKKDFGFFSYIGLEQDKLLAPLLISEKTKEKQTHSIITLLMQSVASAVKKAEDAKGVDSSGGYFIHTIFYIDDCQDRKSLKWHQDWWGNDSSDPEYLIFCVLDRNTSNCNKCQRNNFNDDHPKVTLQIGCVSEDKRKGYYATDIKEELYNPKEDVLLIENIDDKSGSGYIVNQQPCDGSIIIHARSAQKQCSASRISAVIRVRKWNEISSLQTRRTHDRLFDFKASEGNKLDSDLSQLIIKAVFNFGDDVDGEALARLGIYRYQSDNYVEAYKLTEKAIKIKQNSPHPIMPQRDIDNFEIMRETINKLRLSLD
ncbi:hypothetical protein CI610_03174 [invertebrate metagenome]|uniref:Uncharacterized protein n=1 Tax=invertebrate metagenome TaxID=1711999 RepID=A0A2H9T3V7_9ZZZZ